MYVSDDRDRGYTRGGLDVVTAINLFFKGLLLSPIFLLAGYISLMMMKHMIFQGIPAMTTPTEQQREVIRDRDRGLVQPEVSAVEPEIIYPFNNDSIVVKEALSQPVTKTWMGNNDGATVTCHPSGRIVTNYLDC